MRMVPWPALVRGVSKALRPSFMKGQVSILQYSCTSTLAQTQTQPPSSNETTKTENPSNAPKPSTVKTASAGQKSSGSQRPGVVSTAPAKESEDVAVIMKVKEVASALELCANFNSQQRFEVSSCPLLYLVCLVSLY